MSETGWISLHRKIRDCVIFQEKRTFSKFEAWVDILLSANHKDKKFLHGNQTIEVERGSFITSELKLMSRWGWSKTKLRAFLCLLENEQMIVKKSDNKKTTLTVVNYGLYQDKETEEEPQKDFKKTSKEPQKDTNNNDNNDNNDNKKDPAPYKEILELYHSTCISFPKLKSLSDNRRRTLNARWTETKNDISVFQELFNLSEQSDFLSGRKPSEGKPNWKADFDWIINQQNMTKILEGKYNNKLVIVKSIQQSPTPPRHDSKTVDTESDDFKAFLKLRQQQEKEEAEKRAELG